ncbi:MAG: ABC transporter permease [Planctomycetes bacterium]|nr:ABC transporter permease [Planctomycetota bacterium]
MRRAFAVFRREMLSYFTSPVAYIILFVFLLVNGVIFYYYLQAFGGRMSDITRVLYGEVVFWFLALLIPPLLTMRSFSEEKKSGTFELLVTTGISDAALIAGKFFAAWCYFMLLWACLWPYFLMFEYAGDPEWGIWIAFQYGIALLGSVFCATGILASSLTQNQLVAASVGTVINLLVFFLNYFRFLFQPGDLALRYFDYISPVFHFTNDYTNGLIDLRYLVLYGSVTLLFLFGAAKALEWRRWW